MGFDISRTGLDGQTHLNFDALGKLYISVAVVWTALLACGAGFLLYNRHLPALRLRNTHLWTSALVFLHAYWVLCWCAYVLNGSYPCTAEYWIMSLWLPFGIALFQVNGMHLLQVANLQTRFIDSKPRHAAQRSNSRTSRWLTVRNIGLPDTLSDLQKMSIIIGLLLQVIVSLVIYTLSRRFHPSWGVVGQAVGPEECRRSWEWVPSILWQFIWSWIYAPYLLWKVRKIHDLHGWRLQTVLCSLAGLPGTPMWLLALYSPYFSKGLAEASQYFVPPLWFTPGIAAMEASIIIIPCIVVMRSRRLQKETLQQLMDWERNQKSGTSVDTGSTCVQSFETNQSSPSTLKPCAMRSELYSMKALEKALATNINPLLRFSALKEFSGENISFLKNFQEWKAIWSDESSTKTPPNRSFLGKATKDVHHQHGTPARSTDPDVVRREQFALALEIYVSFIDPRYSEFPINISSQQLKDLESIFSPAASTLNARVVDENTVSPFESSPHPYRPDLESGHASAEGPWAPNTDSDRDKDAISIASTALSSSTSSSSSSTSPSSSHQPISPTIPLQQAVSTSLLDLHPRLSADVAVPSSFGAQVFDDANRAVKYSVLTNTWPRFVKDGLAAGMAGGGDDGGAKRSARDLEKYGRDGARDGHGGLNRRFRTDNGLGVQAAAAMSGVQKYCRDKLK